MIYEFSGLTIGYLEYFWNVYARTRKSDLDIPEVLRILVVHYYAS